MSGLFELLYLLGGGGEILRQVRDRKRKVWKITTDPGKAKDTGREKKKKKRFGKKIHTELEREMGSAVTSIVTFKSLA